MYPSHEMFHFSPDDNPRQYFEYRPLLSWFPTDVRDEYGRTMWIEELCVAMVPVENQFIHMGPPPAPADPLPSLPNPVPFDEQPAQTPWPPAEEAPMELDYGTDAPRHRVRRSQPSKKYIMIRQTSTSSNTPKHQKNPRSSSKKQQHSRGRQQNQKKSHPRRYITPPRMRALKRQQKQEKARMEMEVADHSKSETD